MTGSGGSIVRGYVYDVGFWSFFFADVVLEVGSLGRVKVCLFMMRIICH